MTRGGAQGKNSPPFFSTLPKTMDYDNERRNWQGTSRSIHNECDDQVIDLTAAEGKALGHLLERIPYRDIVRYSDAESEAKLMLQGLDKLLYSLRAAGYIS